MRIRWPFMLRSTHEAAVRRLIADARRADEGRDVAVGYARNAKQEIQRVHEILGRVLSWKVPE